MHVPKPGADGLRRYNKWAGNPSGHEEDTSRCVMSVTPNERGGFAHSHQCNRKRGHGPDKLYCKQHDPAETKARWDKKLNCAQRPNRLIAAYREALEKIAAGHNDPRTLAAEALKAD